jgi:diguanylate cyclase (GGDEF)-like protein/PAS domain S-box-containing protein
MKKKTCKLPVNFADLLLDAVFLVDPDGQIVHVTAASERIFGYAPDEMIGRPMIDFVAPQDRARTMEEAKLVVAGQPRIGFENRYVRKDGRLVPIMWSARWSEVDRMRIGVARDVTERKHAEARQAAIYAISEAAHHATDLAALFKEIHRIVAELIPVAALAVAIPDKETNRLDFPYRMDAQGNSLHLRETAASRHCSEVLRTGTPMVLPSGVLSEEEPLCLALPLIAGKEAVGVLLLSSRTPYDAQDNELLHFVSLQIATAIEHKQLHAELVRAARYDELTGLPNRRLFYDRMNSALARSRRTQSALALLYVDVDDFKQINDALGHGAGDLLLKEVAARLQRSVRESDTVARMGGDEFVVLLENIHGISGALSAAEKIKTALREKVPVGGTIVEIKASVGMALYPEDGTDTEQLLQQADRKMYLDKRKR